MLVTDKIFATNEINGIEDGDKLIKNYEKLSKTRKSLKNLKLFKLENLKNKKLFKS